MKVLKVCYFVGFSVIRPTRRVAQLLMMMMMMMMIMVMVNLPAAAKKDILTIHGSFEFVLGSLPCSLRFFRGNPSLPLYSKTNT